MILSNKAYDIMKAISIVILPAIITCYATISMTWGLPLTEEVVATLGAINVLLGALCKLSSNAYLNDVEEIGASEEDPIDEEVIEH